ncbi:DNA replication protein psf2 [Sorochytrium milnesiophthora]
MDTLHHVCYAIELILGLAVAGVQLFNIRYAIQFLQRKSLGPWLSFAQIASSGCGVLSAFFWLAMTVVCLTTDPINRALYVELRRVAVFALILQLYFHVIVVIQRVHIVNAYVFTDRAIDCRLVLMRRYPEILWTLALVGMLYVNITYFLTPTAYLANTIWQFSMMAVDITLALSTFNKVHRMLNTQRSTLVWYKETLRAAMASSSTVLPSGRPEQRPQLTGFSRASIATVVRSWTIMILSQLCSITLYIAFWKVAGDPDLTIAFLYAALLTVSLSQRSSLLYIEAIKQVAMQNRVSKQYLGSTTKTGIETADNGDDDDDDNSGNSGNMAFPRKLQLSFTPEELEFVAENQLVVVEPTSRALTPLRKQRVPLWLAIALRKRALVKVVAPRWMTLESLQEMLKEEHAQPGFSELPLHYMEIAKLLLEAASDDIPDAPAITSLLQDLREIRRSKIREGVSVIDESHVRLDNLGLMEINEIRPTFTTAFATLKRLQVLSQEGGDREEQDDDGATTQSTVGDVRSASMTATATATSATSQSQALSTQSASSLGS